MTTATDTMTHHLPCASRTKLAGANDKKEEPLPPSRLIAPLHIPFERRLQMGSIAVWLSCSLSCSALFLAFWTHSFWFPLALVYLAYIYLDRATPNQGGRRIQTVREWPLWKYLADYFPVKVIKVSSVPYALTLWITNMDPCLLYNKGTWFGPLWQLFVWLPSAWHSQLWLCLTFCNGGQWFLASFPRGDS